MGVFIEYPFDKQVWKIFWQGTPKTRMIKNVTTTATTLTTTARPQTQSLPTNATSTSACVLFG
jgi:hypothetical protein